MSIDKDVMCGIEELRSVAGVIAIVGATAPIMPRSSYVQLRGHGIFAIVVIHHGYRLLVGIVAKAVGIEPDFIDIGIKIIRGAFGEGEDQVGV